MEHIGAISPVRPGTPKTLREDKENEYDLSVRFSQDQRLAYHSELSYVYNLSPSPKRLSKSIVRTSCESLRRTRKKDNESQDKNKGTVRHSKQKRKFSPYPDTISNECINERSPVVISALDIAVTKRVTCKWQPLSHEAKSLFNHCLLQQYKAVVSSLPSILRSSLEREMNEMFSKVKAELVLATGPRKTTKISYSRLKQQVSNLKEKCLSLIQQNNELLRQLVEKSTQIQERKEKNMQFYDPQFMNIGVEKSDSLLCSQSTLGYLMESFEDYLVDLLVTSSNAE